MKQSADPSVGLHDEDEKVLKSVKSSKVIWPIVIGLAVIFYLVSKQLDFGEFRSVNWTYTTSFWIIISILSYSARHLLYSWRLRVLSEFDFSWWKSIELVTILEFASAVSPTNFGGSAVAFFLLIQENISAARSTTIVIYTIIADTLFFVFSIPLLIILFGTIVFIPLVGQAYVWGGLETTLWIVWAIMALYGLLLLYGLFIKPVHLKNLLYMISKWRLLSRSADRICGAADDIEVSSAHIRYMSIGFHTKIVLMTILAWIFRFFTVTAILISLNPKLVLSLWDHFILITRGQALYAVTAYSPTPGGSGVAEILFGQFYGSYVSPGIAVLAAVLWRIITYYPYLILGVIIIPNWIRKLVNKRRLAKQEL